MLQAAAARVDITPPVGVDLQGYAGRTHGAVGVLDPLFARCLVVERERGPRWALISADLISFENDEANQIRALAREALGADAAVSLAATHTHSGPALLRLRNFGERHEAYIAYAIEAIGRCVRDALRRLRPALAVTSTGEASFAVNRRKPTPGGQIALAPYPQGPVDRTVTVTTFFAAGEGDGAAAPIAVVTHYPCHPVTLGANDLISADFPGVYARTVERLFPGTVALYLNGASGNINPPAMDGPKTMERCGLELAGEAIKQMAQSMAMARCGALSGAGASSGPTSLPSTPLAGAQLAFAERTIELPLAPLPPREAVERERAAIEARLRELKEPAGGGARALLALKQWATECLAEIEGGSPSTLTGRPRTQAALQAVRAGAATFVFVPGELFVELGLDIQRRSPFPFTQVVGYANGWVGYLPTEEAVAEGGYEPTAYRYWQNRPLVPAAGRMVADAALELLERAFAR